MKKGNLLILYSGKEFKVNMKLFKREFTPTNKHICVLGGFWSFSVKDTVLVSLRVPRGSGHVEQDNPGIVGFVDDDLVELDGGVHPPDVGVVPEGETRCIYQPVKFTTVREKRPPHVWMCRFSRPDAEHVPEALRRGAARVWGSVLRRLLFGPRHLNSPVVLGAAAAAADAAARHPVSLPAVGVVVVVWADARQPQHGVTVFHQLGLVWYKDTQTRWFSSHRHFSCFFSTFFYRYSCTWGKDTPTDNTRSPNADCIYSTGTQRH